MGIEDEGGAVIASPSDHSDKEMRDSSGSSDDESNIEDMPLKKRQKTTSGQTGAIIQASAEEKALKLLSSKTFF